MPFRPLAPEEICRRLIEKRLPPDWVSSLDSFRQVETIPLSETGKLGLKRLWELALEGFC
jgi:hypothetical protein